MEFTLRRLSWVKRTACWTWKAHPDFCHMDDTKEALRNMMGEEFNGVQYALLPKTIKYKRITDGVKMTTNDITLQVAKTTCITAAYFCADMAEHWQRLTVKTGARFSEKNFHLIWKRRRYR
jgi:hypothetical protein